MNQIPKDKSPMKSISHTGLVYKRFPKLFKISLLFPLVAALLKEDSILIRDLILLKK